LWPEGIIDDAVDDKARDWERWVLMKAAKTMRELSAVTTPAVSTVDDLDPAGIADLYGPRLGAQRR
jgi:hypothetical protein